jgi:hypothetical protein
MDVEVFCYEVEDATNGTRARWPLPATLAFIRLSPDRKVISSKRIIDERLVDGEGRALFAPGGDEVRQLRDFESSGGITTEPLDINVNQHKLAPLIRLRLIDTEAKGGRLEMKISALGYLAMEQLAA